MATRKYRTNIIRAYQIYNLGKTKHTHFTRTTSEVTMATCHPVYLLFYAKAEEVPVGTTYYNKLGIGTWHARFPRK